MKLCFLLKNLLVWCHQLVNKLLHWSLHFSCSGLTTVAKLIGCNVGELKLALSTRKMRVGNDTIVQKLSLSQVRKCKKFSFVIYLRGNWMLDLTHLHIWQGNIYMPLISNGSKQVHLSFSNSLLKHHYWTALQSVWWWLSFWKWNLKICIDMYGHNELSVLELLLIVNLMGCFFSTNYIKNIQLWTTFVFYFSGNRYKRCSGQVNLFLLVWLACWTSQQITCSW